MKKTKLYIISESIDGKEDVEGIYMLIDETGKVLYSHFCSNKFYAKGDLIEQRPERIKECKKLYGEYEVLFLGEDDMTIEKLTKLNNKNYSRKEEIC